MLYKYLVNKMKKIISILLFLFLFSFSSAIAVIAPVVYVATLSLTAFLANTIITIAVFIAAKSFSNKDTINKKKLSSKIGFVMEIIGKTTLLILSTIVAIIIVNPVLFNEAIYTGLIAAIICEIILFLYNYKKISIVDIQTKKIMLKSITIFCIFVFISSSLVGYYSIETKAIIINGQGIEQQQSAPASTPLFDISNSLGSSQKADSYTSAQEVQTEKEKITQLLIFNPMNLNECIITWDTQSKSIKPTNNCFSLTENVQKRIICPIILNSTDFTSGTIISSKGSCVETYTIQ